MSYQKFNVTDLAGILKNTVSYSVFCYLNIHYTLTFYKTTNFLYAVLYVNIELFLYLD